MSLGFVGCFFWFVLSLFFPGSWLIFIFVSWLWGNVAIKWMFVSPGSLYVETKSPTCCYLEVRSLGSRWLRHKGRALMNKIYTFIKEAPERSLSPSSVWDTVKRLPSMTQVQDRLAPWSWTLASRTVSNSSWQIDGETMETLTDFIFGAPKSLQMVTAAMKLKDACFLEEKLWPT